MVDNGVEVPAGLFAAPQRTRDVDLRRGILLIAVGIGLALFVGIVSRRADVATSGALPLLVGIGYLVVWRMGRRESAPSTSEPAQK
jgi:hypothetical protein